MPLSNMIIDPAPFEQYMRGAGDKGSSHFDWKSLAGAGAMTGLSMALSAFAPKTPGINQQTRKIEEQSDQLHQTGANLVGTGGEALSPVLNYFKALVSGDPTAVLQAAGPERARVMDQYDTARRSNAEFSPRGGGQASASMQSRMAEARDLASTTNAIRSNAATQLSGIGQTAISQGLTAESAATQALAQVLGPLLSQRNSDKESIAKQFAGYAELIAPFILMAL